ncbi:bacteriophage protein [Burkholderia contaminans]|uniref:hypothetical protein n=1 Tax=Burkholderia contaminans TaxID=488447 RepID=UPI001453616A|nr:hypothetical protein [Burkholderia contaminans]VWC80719.1 bacteriophage protein [Burkholderia contaminans]
MSSHNEKSPLTQNASGQERGPAIEARGLSEEDNGTARENCSAEKYPAPVQASEAVNQRPGMEEDQTEVVPTAEDILDASAVGGNGTSSKVSRVDVLTIVETERDGNRYEFAVNGHGGLIRVVARMEDDDHDYPLGKRVRDFLLGASHVEQHEAAPADSHYTHPGCEVCTCPTGVRQAERASDVLLEPPVADERAALPRYTEWMHLRIHGVWSDGVPSWARDHAGHMNDLTAAIAVIEELAARTSSPNAAGAERIAHEVWAAAQLGPG